MSVYWLKHKDISVAKLSYENGFVSRVLDIGDMAHAPISCVNVFDRFDVRLFQDWWNRRNLPKLRQKDFGFLSLDSLVAMNYGCNLSDHYWLCPDGSGLQYSDVNFYENAFAMVLPSGHSFDEKHLINPVFSSNGELSKTWFCQDDVRYLAKFDKHQESDREVIGSRWCKNLGIPYVSYQKQVLDNRICSVCACMTDLQTELVLAYDISIRYGRGARGSDADIQDFLFYAEDVGIFDVRRQVSQMVFVDYLLRNTDRHWCNFGLVRNPDTLEYTGMIPLFDFGNSLWHDASVISYTDVCSKFSGRMLLDDVFRYGTDLVCQTRRLSQCLGVARLVLQSSNMVRSRRFQMLDALEQRFAVMETWLGQQKEGSMVHDFEAGIV